MKQSRCISCGCTDARACHTAHGTCGWTLVDRKKGEGVCSACATLAQNLFAILAPEDVAAMHPRAGQGLRVAELAMLLGKSGSRIREALNAMRAHGLATADTRHRWYRTEFAG